MDLTGGLSKLSPPLLRIWAVHREIRQREPRNTNSPRHIDQIRRLTDELLHRAEAAYRAGGTIKAVAKEVGLGHERLAHALRERGVSIRRSSPSPAEVAEMQRRYSRGDSLERIGVALGYSAGTVRNRLMAGGIRMRDTQGRAR